MTNQENLNVGCGNRYFGKEWTHVDVDNSYQDFPVIKCDIKKLSSRFFLNCTNRIYASHVLEYFDQYDAEDILIDWHSILKPGGTLMIAVPDFCVMANLYSSYKCTLDDIIGPLYGRMESNGKIIYHKVTYDFDTLYRLLNSVGFKYIQKYDFNRIIYPDDSSKAHLPHDRNAIDNTNFIKGIHTLISLNVICMK